MTATTDTALQPGRSAPPTPLLQVSGLAAGYRGRNVIEDIGVTVAENEAIGVIGHNGAGKTTLLKALFGVLKPQRGTVTYLGASSTRPSVADSIRRGMAMVPADRFVFADLTVRENMQLARGNAASAAVADAAHERLRELFPVVWERWGQQAGSLSGGERRMLSVAMALTWQPRLLILDEPSLGLAPALAQRLFDALRLLVSATDMSVICVEQDIPHLLRLVDRVYVLREGRLAGELAAGELAERGEYWEFF